MKREIKKVFGIITLFALLFIACSKGTTGQNGVNDSITEDKSELPTDPSELAEEGVEESIDSFATDESVRDRSVNSNANVSIGIETLIQSHLETLAGKGVAIIANQTSVTSDGVHIVDTLLALGIKVKKVFAPEHGFRGNAGAGVKIKSGVDTRTGLPIISLYGKNKKPSASQLANVEVVIFDIQDVGTRHYTYISTMSYAMEACAENKKEMIVLDRPNPNGWYVDGPMMERAHRSFIGKHEVPIVHGMTVGEYAQMVNGEGWLRGGVKCNLQVMKCQGYRHDMTWDETGLEWIAPSPNLATEYAAYLYPALCWFEPTQVSVGRGTHDAFTIIGMPWHKEGTSLEFSSLQLNDYSFTPVSLPTKAKYPKHQNKKCKGYKFRGRVEGKALFIMGLTLLESFYKETTTSGFFKSNFERWAGNTRLKQSIIAQKDVYAIYDSWQDELDKFKETRDQYLLYTDF